MSARRAAPLALAALLLAAPPVLAGRDVMLVLDNSGSMRRNDPTRLATPAVLEFIRAQPRDTRVGIVLFASEAELVMPLTPAEVAAEDVGGALAAFGYRGRWTQTAAGVERALYELRSEGRAGGTRAIVLMTDGLIDTGDAARDAELNRWLRTDLARQAATDRVTIFGVAFTERADYRLLQSLATTTGGDYFRVLAARDIARALQRIDAAMAGPSMSAPAPLPAAGSDAAPSAETRDAPVPAAHEAATPALAEAGDALRPWPPWLAGLAAVIGLAVVAGLWRRLGARRARRDRGGPVAVLYDHQDRHELGDRPVVIGRAGGNDPSRQYVLVPEKTVGRWHATIERRGHTFWVRDEGSVNGTFVNEERVIGERPLKHRDILRIHTHTFDFEIPELADATRTMMQGAQRLNQSGA